MDARTVSSRRPSRAARRELAVFALAYGIYFGVRALTEGAPWRAMANARELFRLETSLGIDWEGAVQSVVVRSQVLVDAANAVYIYGHWPILIAAGVLLFRHRPAHYYRLRNVCLLSGLLGLFIFALFPVAPPRLTDLPLIDTVTRDSDGYRQIFPASLVNQFAAMPSFHAGWNVVLGVVVFQATRSRLLRAFAVALPAAMILSVVATANHFVADVVVGVAIVLAALAAEIAYEHRRGAPRLECNARQHRQRRRPDDIRRRAPRRQRPGAAGDREHARVAARRG